MNKEQSIKLIVEKYIEDNSLGAYTLMHNSGYRDGSDMDIFHTFFDEIMSEKQKQEVGNGKA